MTKAVDQKTNVTDIDTNTAGIATNVTDIAGNSTRLTATEAETTSNTNRITATENITTANTAGIAANASDIGTNASNINSNTGRITTNETNIGTNTAGIASLNNQVSSLTTSVQANREVASDGIAIALASKAPTLPAGANQAITMGFGHYDGRTAFAGGFTARVAPRSQLYGTVGLGFNTGKVGLSAGYQFSW